MTIVADKKNQTSKELDSELENALEATFPASDPVSIGEGTSDKPDRPANRRPAQIDKHLVDELAAEVARKKGAA
jgi:hypothetical protein